MEKGELASSEFLARYPAFDNILLGKESAPSTDLRLAVLHAKKLIQANVVHFDGGIRITCSSSDFRKEGIPTNINARQIHGVLQQKGLERLVPLLFADEVVEQLPKPYTQVAIASAVSSLAYVVSQRNEVIFKGFYQQSLSSRMPKLTSRLQKLTPEMREGLEEIRSFPDQEYQSIYPEIVRIIEEFGIQREEWDDLKQPKQTALFAKALDAARTAQFSAKSSRFGMRMFAGLTHTYELVSRALLAYDSEGRTKSRTLRGFDDVVVTASMDARISMISFVYDMMQVQKIPAYDAIKLFGTLMKTFGIDGYFEVLRRYHIEEGSTFLPGVMGEARALRLAEISQKLYEQSAYTPSHPSEDARGVDLLFFGERQNKRYLFPMQVKANTRYHGSPVMFPVEQETRWDAETFFYGATVAKQRADIPLIDKRLFLSPDILGKAIDDLRYFAYAPDIRLFSQQHNVQVLPCILFTSGSL